ncbi:MAG: FAD-dependent oxidoreductase [Chloroflexi bacterium]|nr:FAD-dependent oxidoreductase [Chloroflexota bacterium]
MERKALFEPLPLGGIRLKNRLVMAPMGTNYASTAGEVTERLLDYYEERARGGVGLIIVEAANVAFPLGSTLERQPRADDDGFLPCLEGLARRLHANGVGVLLQLCHGGRVARSRLYGQVPVAPSPLAPPGGEIPRELTTGEIPEIVALFVRAARRAQRAGFDGVEVHAAHSYLLNQFLSPAANRRPDGYGGDLKGRARLLLEVLRETRREVGRGFVLSCRINGAEFGLTDGITPQDSQDLAPLLEEAGADIIHVSAFGYNHPVMRASAPSEPGFELPLAEGVKKKARVPVIAVGRLTPAMAEGAIQEGRVDLVAFGRALLADPQAPNKIALGREEDVCPCINCLKCRDGLQAGNPVTCPVNPTLGRERELSLSSARRRKKVLVVGGGVAGMEAARVAALRGHQVWLYEKARSLGGQLRVASKPPEKQDLDGLNVYLQAQIGKLPVRVKRGKAVTPEVVEALGPQAVVLAMGSAPFTPGIPGIEQNRVVLAAEVLRGRAVAGDRVVVIGGEMVGCETADFLAGKGRKVTVVRRGEEFATRISPTNRRALLARLAQKGVELLAGASYQRITPQGLLIRDREGRERLLEADTIVMAAGARPQDDGLAQALEGKVPQLYWVGDCVEPRTIQEAMAEAYTTAQGL